MAGLSLVSRSFCSKRLLSLSVLRCFLSSQSAVASEKLSVLPSLRTVSVFRSRVPVQTASCFRFCSAKAGIVQSKYKVDIPETSLSEFVLRNFHEHGDDIAMYASTSLFCFFYFFTNMLLQSHPGRVMIDGTSGKSFTYSDLSTSIKKLGSALTKRGFKKGDVFALYLPNVPEYPILFFGVIALGGVVTTLNPTYTEKEVAYQLENSGAKYIIAVPPNADNAKKAAVEVGISDVFVIGKVEGCESLETLLNDDGLAFPDNVPINPKDDICVMPYSSGTTGLPKGVMLSHHNIVSQLCMVLHDTFRPHPMRGTVLGLLPFFHIFGMVIVMAHYLRRGGKIICMQQFDGENMLKLLQDFKVHSVYLVPPVVTFLAKSPLVDNYDLTSVDTIISGAAPLGEQLTRAVRQRIPTVVALGQGYGLTETSPAAMLCPRNNCKLGAVGVMLPNLEGKVVDVQTGEILGPNQDGEICIRGPSVMKGYLNNPKATEECITPDGWFHSGDTGYYDEEGHFFIVDRLKELIKYKGFQVSPAELEALLHTHPKVLDVAVIGIPNEDAGEVPKAFVVPKGEVTETEIVDFVAGRVAPHKKLRGGVQFIEEIPKTASGKILKRVLRDL